MIGRESIPPPDHIVHHLRPWLCIISQDGSDSREQEGINEPITLRNLLTMFFSSSLLPAQVFPLQCDSHVNYFVSMLKTQFFIAFRVLWEELLLGHKEVEKRKSRKQKMKVKILYTYCEYEQKWLFKVQSCVILLGNMFCQIEWDLLLTISIQE